MSGAALVLHQFRYDQKAFWRNPAAVVFAVALPVILLVILDLAYGNDTVHVRGSISAKTYFVPAIIALAIIGATMQNLAMSLTIAREQGRLKRSRGTPMPSWIFIAGRVGNALVVAFLVLVLVVAIGRIAYGVPIPWGDLPALLVTVAVGAATFCCLGIALTAAIPSQDAAAPIVNALLLPLYFLSGVFIPDDRLPSGVIGFADALPIRQFFEPLLSIYSGSGPIWGHVAVVAAWGVLGLLLAIRYFRWTPKRD